MLELIITTVDYKGEFKVDKLVNDTLSAWLLVETLQPGTYENNEEYLDKSKFQKNEQQKKIHDFTNFFSIWKDERFIINPEKKKQGHIHFQMYRHCFKFGEIEQEIRNMFNDEPTYNPDRKDCYGYTFMVNESGHVLTETIHVPMLMCAMKYIQTNKFVDIETLYNDHIEKFKNKCEELLGGNELTENKLLKLDALYAEYFAVFKSTYQGIFQHVSLIKFVKTNDKNDEFNSFFITDIEQARKNPNETLKNYIHGIKDKEKVDIDENRSLIESYLEPDMYPDGRWPSLVEHKLSLMQQVAVNQITNDQQNISSVNGPPGTGKTTLLKDIFAHIVVERAKEITTLKKPSSAFYHEKVHETDTYSTSFLNNKLCNFKMVVTSSGNGAVENISKDLPKKDEVMRPSNSDFPEYEQAYNDAAKELNSVSDISERLIGDSAWGLFSGVLGKKDNIDKVMKEIFSFNTVSDSEYMTLNQLLYSETVSSEDWVNATTSFNKTLQKIKELKQEMYNGVKLYKTYKNNESTLNNLSEQYALIKDKLVAKNEKITSFKTKLNSTENELLFVTKQLIDLEEFIKLSKPKRTIVDNFKSWFSNEKQSEQNEKKANLLKEKIELQTNWKEYKFESEELIFQYNQEKKEANSIKEKIEHLKKENEKFITFKEKHQDVTVPDDKFWETSNYNERQESVLWTSNELQFQRGLLFIKAMILHKLILVANHKNIQKCLTDFKNRFSLSKTSPQKVENAWNVFHLIFPVVSTTFASFGNMYRNLPSNFIDYLFIDEAGQALPQSAVGALQKSRHVIAVGDPLQIEPVVTIDRNLIDSVRKSYNVPERLLNISASVQSIADNANCYGYWKGEIGKKHWIGIPLWVHRRCLNPMFTISNKIAYDEKMVLPDEIKKDEKKGKTGKVSWKNVKGKAISKQFVTEHGDETLKLIAKDWEIALQTTGGAPNVFVISPFTEVKSNISSMLKSKLPKYVNANPSEVKKWADKSVGTVHTFQGKEADKVYFVTGTDNNQNGAINWSCQKPNLINVAVTRAKKEFYIIGDQDRISEFNFYNTIVKEKNM